MPLLGGGGFFMLNYTQQGLGMEAAGKKWL